LAKKTGIPIHACHARTSAFEVNPFQIPKRDEQMAGQFTVKILSTSDLLLLLNAEEDVFDNPVNENLATEFLADPRHHIVAAMDEDVMIGFASAVHYILPDKPRELWINEVGVAPSHQNQGVGKAIMQEMLRLGRELGCKTAWVLTERDNEPANGLYKSVGGKVDTGDTILYEFDTKDD
jgi:aminoglycoside 6'-N-acetyltransferase I